MTPEEFRRALHDGLGRALREAASVPAAERREILLDACLHNRAIDPQLDSDRSAWLIEIVDAGGDFDWIALRIVTGMAALEDLWDVEQTLHLAVRLARRGVEGARTALVTEFERQRFREEWVGGLQIVALDGVAGIVHVAQRIGRRLEGEVDYWIDDSLVTCAAELHGESAVATALREAAKSDSCVARFEAAVAEHRIVNAQPQKQALESWRSYDFAGVRSHLGDLERGSRVRLHWLRRWGKDVATEGDLEQALEALVAERDPVRQLPWLSVFASRAMPRVEPGVLAMLDSADEDLSRSAHQALGRVAHPEVRRLALDRLREGTCDARTVSLLVENIRLGDEALLVDALPNHGDRDDLHWLASGVNDVLARNGSIPGSALLSWSYEHAACASCREQALELMLALKCAPLEVLEECHFDSSQGIRQLVESA